MNTRGITLACHRNYARAATALTLTRDHQTDHTLRHSQLLQRHDEEILKTVAKREREEIERADRSLDSLLEQVSDQEPCHFALGDCFKNLDDNLRVYFYDLLSKYRHLFRHPLEVTRRPNHEELPFKNDIELEDPAARMDRLRQPRRLHPEAFEFVKAELLRLLHVGIIKPSTSIYASDLVVVKRKDGRYRMCVDFRNLNENTKAINWPIPSVDALLNELSQYKLYATLDLSEAYLQVRNGEESAHLTTFITHFGCFAYTRMPFGLRNGTSIFQYNMQCVLAPCEDGIFFYVDNLFVAADTPEHLLETLKKIFIRFENFDLQVKLKECRFFSSSIDALGFIVSHHGWY